MFLIVIEGLNNKKNKRSLENQDTEISEFIGDDGQLPNVQPLADGDVWSADVKNSGGLKIKIKYKNEY